MKIYNNIELLQINLSSATDRFYFPDNSKLNGKKINSLSFYGSPFLGMEQSPFDGREVVYYGHLQQMYLQVIKDSKDVLHENVPLSQSTINKLIRVDINSAIDLQLCAVNYVGSTPEELDGKCLLVYATYDTIEDNEYVPQVENVVTVDLTTKERAVRLDTLIDDYIIAQGKKIKRIEVVPYSSDLEHIHNFFYLDLREYGGRSFKYVPMLRMVNGGMAEVDLANLPIEPLLLNDFNVDFRNSWIINSCILSGDTKDWELKATIMFYY